MSPHESSLPGNDIFIPATPPTSPADSEMTFDIGWTPTLSPEAKILLDYLKNDANGGATPTTVAVYYYLSGETDSSDSSSSPPSPLPPPPRSSEEGGTRSSRSRDPTRSTGSQDRITPSTRDSQMPGFQSTRQDDGATKGRPKNRYYRRTSPPPDEGNKDDDTSLTARLRENLRSLLGTLPATTGRALPASDQRPAKPIVAGASRTSIPGLRPVREHRHHHVLDEWEFSFLDPEYDADSGATPSPPPPLLLPHPPLPPVQSPPLAAARLGPITTLTKRRRTATNVANPTLAPSRPFQTPQSSPTPASPRLESRPIQPGLIQVSSSGSPATISQPVSTTHQSPIGSTGPTSASLSVTTLIHPPASGVPSAVVTHSESLLTRGGSSSAAVIRSLLARRSMQLTPLQAATSSRSPLEIFSPNRQHSRRPARTRKPLTSPPASRIVAPAEESQTVSRETEAVNEPSFATSGRVTMNVDNLSVRARRRRGDRESGGVQVLRSARIRDKQAKRETDIVAAQGSSNKKRKQ